MKRLIISRRFFLGLIAVAASGIIIFFQKAIFRNFPLSKNKLSEIKKTSNYVDYAEMQKLLKSIEEKGTKAFLVIINGEVVYEGYAGDYNPTKKHYIASAAKALVGGMALLVALNDKWIDLDDPAWKYIPIWKSDNSKSEIKIRDLATHSSGIEDAEENGEVGPDLKGWKGTFWKERKERWDIALNKASILFSPGSQYAYSNPGVAALAYAITSSLKSAPQSDIFTLLKERIMAPLGISESMWSISYNESYQVDGMKLYSIGGGSSYTANAIAKIGQLMLEQGYWEGQQLLNPELVRKMTVYSGSPPLDSLANNPPPGVCWHTNFNGIFPSLPNDAYLALGAGHQVLLVVPSLKLIMVRSGSSLGGPERGKGFFNELEVSLFKPLMKAIVMPPYPYSNLIKKVQFAPIPSIIRKAMGSDNWPITWADDNHQYTAYGDGWGFEPKIRSKLSLGFAKIIGSPKDFQGVNIRATSGEAKGDGKQGPKASGMLMVDGLLYMWIRNLENSQLAWSADRGKTWEWGFRFETSFGSPSFLNFGKNYQDARDEYVYIYSQDGPSAYESDDHLVLARVPKDKIRVRSAYEFFSQLNDVGQPSWTKDIKQRGAVFSHFGKCQRVDTVYNPGLKRFLMALGFNFEGGWGIFDAPNPWGPWTTVFYTEKWDLGKTHGYRLPSKWISDNGKTMYLVFSGIANQDVNYDAFCVRKLTLEVREQEQ